MQIRAASMMCSGGMGEFAATAKATVSLICRQSLSIPSVACHGASRVSRLADLDDGVVWPHIATADSGVTYLKERWVGDVDDVAA